MTVAAHVQTLDMKVAMYTLTHVDRSASPEFQKSVARLKADGNYKCWISGSTEDLQVHHFGCEWSEQGECDLTELGKVMLALDVYGYNKLPEFAGKPIESVDDVRVMMVLSQKYHTGADHATGTGTGIHNMPFGWWLEQRIAKKGEDPIPQDGESITDTEGRVDKNVG
ncbi:MAG: hypothetical protein P4N59_03345 [Negativicutes bacterium]|nr:hypothetical protein [Negativicutes bacterium]